MHFNKSGLIKRFLALILALQIPFGCLASTGYPSQVSRYWLIMGEMLGARDVSLENPRSFDEVLSPKLPEAYRDYLTLSLFATADRSLPVEESQRFAAPYSWRDLELFPHLFDAINRTTTVFGRAMLAGMLTEPLAVTNIQELQRRQEIIKLLRTDKQKRKSLQYVLQRIHKAEEILLLFHMSNKSDRKASLKQYYTPRVFQPEWFKEKNFVGKFYDKIDSSPGMNFVMGSIERLIKALEFTHMLHTLGMIGDVTMNNPLTNHIFPDPARDLENLQRSQNRDAGLAADFQRRIGSYGFLLGSMAYGVTRIFNGLKNVGGTTKMVQDALFLPFMPFKYWDEMKTMITVHRVLHDDLIRLAAAVNSLRTAKYALRTLGLDKIIPECHDLFSYLDVPGQVPDFEKLLDILSTDTFKGTASSWSLFSHYGRLFAANHLMDKTKDVWARLFRAIGYIDAYLSVALLMDEYEDKHVKFCYPEYVAADQPSIELQSFWNPVVALNKDHRDTDLSNVIVNNLTFGQNEKNIMLTGPNAGGKSTIVRGVGHSIFLAQTLGIAPAASMRLTPFTMLNTAMNLRDSQAEGLSGFKTELDTACNYLMGKVNKLKPGQFAFNLFDELFRATSQQDAQNTLYRFAKKFSKPNMLTIYATHNHGDLIVGLENENRGEFSNYCVEAPDGEHPDFKLKRGYSRQSVVKKLWQEYGLDDRTSSVSAT